MHHPVVAVVAAITLAGCADPVSVQRAEVEALMDVQREAWNRGDLRTFVGYYHADMTFCGSGGVTRGTENLLANYEARYPTAAERGVLAFDLVEMRPIGDGSALVLGRYRLDRAEPASGFFSLLVQRGADGLRILHDHTTESPK